MSTLGPVRILALATALAMIAGFGHMAAAQQPTDDDAPATSGEDHAVPMYGEAVRYFVNARPVSGKSKRGRQMWEGWNVPGVHGPKNKSCAVYGQNKAPKRYTFYVVAKQGVVDRACGMTGFKIEIN